MNHAYELHDQPDLVDPILVVAFDGWIDAGSAMSIACRSIVDQADGFSIAQFDLDTFIDFRAHRPVLTMIDGVSSAFDWPSIDLVAGTDLDGRDLLILHGSEPDSAWFRFLDVVSDLSRLFGVTRLVTIGAYPAAVPHTRPTRITVTSTAEALIDPTARVLGHIEFPAGIGSAIERRLADDGIPGIGLWAQVPHYAAALPYPPAAVTLIDELAARANRRFDTSAIGSSIASALEQLDDLVERSPERQQLVTELERLHDDAIDLHEDLPSGDQLAADFQDFLRNLDSDK